MAEKPVMHLIQHFDGTSASPKCWSKGPIGKSIMALDKEQGPFVRFNRIRSPDLPVVDRAMLVSQEDWKVFYDFVRGINDGRVPAYLEHKKAVPTHIARNVYS